MRVLVTGHKGYIGTVMVPMLLARRHEVVGLDNGLFAECTFPGTIEEVPEIRKDIRDVDLDDLRGFDAVIHLAGLSNDPMSDLDPHLTYEINHLASVRLAEFAREAGVERFVFSSSCSNYGQAGDDLVTEEAELHPVTAYGHSKVLVERDVAPLATPEFSPTFLRNATVYGASARLRGDLVLNNLVAWAATTGKVLLKSDGTPWRPIVHVEDVVRAFIAVLDAPRELVHNQAFNVGRTSENYRISQIAEIVRQTVPGSRVEFDGGAGPDKRCYRVDFSKMERVLPAFQPCWDASQGAVQLYQAYQRARLRANDIEAPRYKRLEHLKQLIRSGRLATDLRWSEIPMVSHA
jgi:nucleoside-diphosphate-sugar epimerase